MWHNMKISENGLNFLKKEEGEKLSSYLDVAGIWTIGVGLTHYPNGVKVKANENISEVESTNLFLETVRKYEDNVNRMVLVKLTQNQFDALVSLCYNIGMTAFNNSTALKEINKNPNNEGIKYYIEAWRYATVQGIKKPLLLSRRQRETDLYFKYD